MTELAHVPERREFPRREVSVPAFVERHASDHFACRVVDLSRKGIRITADGLALPDTFTVILKLNWNMRRQCKVVWRKGYVVAVQFTGQED